MPCRNVLKHDTADTFYHVYARGASKQKLFREDSDYAYFTSLYARYLANEKSRSKCGVLYPNYSDQVNLLAYCLMGNHFHMLVYQIDEHAMAALMKCIMSSYSGYYNLKYGKSGSPFESTYKASTITNQTYLLHISRYIHLNPRYWMRYKYSSIRQYLAGSDLEWLNVGRVRRLFAGRDEYRQFLEDYQGSMVVFNEIKHCLADR
jgi:putative transposase